MDLIMENRTFDDLTSKLDEIRKQNEMSLLQNEITLLERQLQDLEVQHRDTMVQATKTLKPRRILSTIPKGRPDSSAYSEPPKLSWHDSRIDDRFDTSGKTPADGDKLQPLTSTPKTSIGVSDQTVSSTPDGKLKQSSVKVKPATFDGTGSWLDYRAHFDTVAEINGWTKKEKGLYLAVSLRGSAQGVFGNIPTESKEYDKLVKALGERFAPPNQTELYRVQLRERKQTASETLSALGQDVRRLANLAYPTAPADVRETLAKEQFIDALHSSDMRLRVKQARPSDLNDAVRHAVELEAYHKAEKRKTEGQGYLYAASQEENMSAKETDSRFEQINSTLKVIQEELKQLKSSRTQNDQAAQRNQNIQYNTQRTQRPSTTTQDPKHSQRFQRKCFNCGKPGHLKWNCKAKQATQPEAAGTDAKKGVNVSGVQSTACFYPH